jgi:hypothetical protein
MNVTNVTAIWGINRSTRINIHSDLSDRSEGEDMKVVSVSTKNGVHYIAELIPHARRRDGLETYKISHVEPQPIYTLRKALRVAERYAQVQGIVYLPFVRRGTPVDLVEEVMVQRSK